MNNFGGMGGHPYCGGNDGSDNNFMMTFLFMMILCPGMFGDMGDNSMLFFLLLLMTMGGGRMF
jgi:hypothetical protein